MKRLSLAAGAITTAVYTSPHPTPELDPLPAIVAAIGRAKATIHASVYSLTSVPIVAALEAAALRGLSVTVVMDATEYLASTSQGPALAAVLNGPGVTACGMRLHGSEWILNHSKCIVVDAALPRTYTEGDEVTVAVINGSYNFTTQAETENVECCEIKTGVQVTRVMAPTYVAQILADFAKATTP